MNRQVRRVGLILTIMFIALFAMASSIQVVRTGELYLDSRNVRASYETYKTQRGAILVGGEAIVTSTAVNDDYRFLREYESVIYSPITGYYSVFSGTTGIERAMNNYLSGQSGAQFFEQINALLDGTPVTGAAVELTIDPDAQRAAWDALGNRKGAVVATASSERGQSKRKHGVNQAELPLMRDLAGRLGLIEHAPDVWSRHPLVYVVEAADDICYALIDLEDAVELGHLGYEEVASLMKDLVDRGARRQLYEALLDDSEAKLELLRLAAIHALVHEAEARFIQHHEALLRGEFAEDLLDWRKASAGEVIARAKALARERVYVDHAKQSYEGQSAWVISGVLAHLLEGAEALSRAGGDGTDIGPKARDAVARLGKFRPRPNDTPYQRILRVTDYVSAMTDRYLMRLVDDLRHLGYFENPSV